MATDWPARLKQGKDRKATYHEYLASEEWQAKRVGVYEQAGGRCQVCNDSSDLRVHHRTYERVGEEAPGDLTLLCDRCHALFHDKLEVVKTPKRRASPRRPKRSKYSDRHHPCTRCGRRWTTKAMCRPCRKKSRRKSNGELTRRGPVTQDDIRRLADAMNGKWKSTSRRERMQESLAESKRNGAVQARPAPSLRKMRPSGGRGAS